MSEVEDTIKSAEEAINTLMRGGSTRAAAMDDSVLTSIMRGHVAPNRPSVHDILENIALDRQPSTNPAPASCHCQCWENKNRRLQSEQDFIEKLMEQVRTQAPEVLQAWNDGAPTFSNTLGLVLRGSIQIVQGVAAGQADPVISGLSDLLQYYNSSRGEGGQLYILYKAIAEIGELKRLAMLGVIYHDQQLKAPTCFIDTTTPKTLQAPPPAQSPPPAQPPPPAGGGTVTGQGENTVVKKPDGSTVVITPGGVTIVVKSDGGVVVVPVGGGDVPGRGGAPNSPGQGSTVTGQGHNTVVVTPNGTAVVIMPNGTTIVTKPGCGVTVIPPSGGMTPGTVSDEKKTCESEKQRTCKSLGEIYKYQTPEGALEGLENEWKFPSGTLRKKNRETTTEPPCAGEGLHYDAVDDRGNKWGSITGCPCCLDTDAGPIPTWRWAYHKRREQATDDLPHPGGIIVLPGDPGHPGTGIPPGPHSHCGHTFSIRSISTGDTEDEAKRNARENADWAAKQRCPQQCPAEPIDWTDEGCSQHGSRWGCSGTGNYTCHLF